MSFQVCHPPARLQLLAPLHEEPRLAYTRLPHDPHTLPPATDHVRQGRVQRGQFVCASDERAARPQLPLGPRDGRRVQPHDLVGAHGGRLPWHQHGRDLLETDGAPDQAGRGLSAEQPAGSRALLQRLDRQGEVPDDSE